ncbi:membrane anchor subunit of succinate dehydrogenase, Sdh4 [Irineochytrium annulatum]|nr:membrane anchor subunit of succinate dehydrogenase, Sdh4 [Irineochytrium annulatum]
MLYSKLQVPTIGLLRRGIVAASFHSGRVTRFQKSLPALSSTAAVDNHEKSKLHGSYHWSAERALSVLTIPVIATAFIAGPVSYNDLLLGIVIPLHTHFGIDSMITDYIPHRVYGVLNTVFNWALRIGTGLCLYGCYMFNTNDIGITAFIKQLWTGKK